jgi:hypothetical protein
METHEMLPENKSLVLQNATLYILHCNIFLIQVLNVAYVTQNALKLQQENVYVSGLTLSPEKKISFGL